LPQGLQAATDGGAELVVIDTAPHSEAAAMAATRAADLVLIPCRAGILDLRAIGSTAELVKLAQKPAFVVLNAVPPRATQLLADARAAVQVHDLEVAPLPSSSGRPSDMRSRRAKPRQSMSRAAKPATKFPSCWLGSEVSCRFDCKAYCWQCS
jgi:cellulose biosynthesis protein BcsQ